MGQAGDRVMSISLRGRSEKEEQQQSAKDCAARLDMLLISFVVGKQENSRAWCLGSKILCLMAKGGARWLLDQSFCLCWIEDDYDCGNYLPV